MKRIWQNWLTVVLVLAFVAPTLMGWQSVTYAQEENKTTTVAPTPPPHTHHSLMEENRADEAASLFAEGLKESMRVMHEEMMKPPMTGNNDRDFLATMIPHHQGAIDMAKLVLLYGKDERTRRLAQGIIIEQQSEIEAMRRQLAELDDMRKK